MNNFTYEEEKILLEAARMAIGDGDTFEILRDSFYLTDDAMVELREKLYKVLTN